MGSVVALLKVFNRDREIKSIPLRDGASIRIGRNSSAELQLDDPSVSRSHATITASSSGVVISDLSSTNGTYVNGGLISIPVDIQASDVVDIGPFKLTVAIHSSESFESTTIGGRTMTAQLRPTSAVVLVGRIRGFKEMQNSLKGDAVNKMWAMWRKIVGAAVDGNGGKIDKVLHECLVAVWFGHDLHTVSGRAVRAAQQIDLHTRQYSVCGEWPHHHTHPLVCSLAMSSGLALTGSVGGKDGLRDFAVLGDTINLAFRVAEITEQLSQSVFISNEIAQELESAVRTQVVGAVQDHNTGGSTEVFAVQL